MAISGSQAVLEVSLDGSDDSWVDVSADGLGFTGFDTTNERTNEQVPGAGPVRFKDTNHSSESISFSVNDNSVTRPLFWEACGRRSFVRWSPEGTAAGSPYTVYESFLDVTKTAPARGLLNYEVSGPSVVAPRKDTH